MQRISIAAYGIISYLLFLGSFTYFILFAGGIIVPRTVDNGPLGSTGEALAINIGLLLLFGVQHSVMARRSFKEWWTRFVPKSIERTTYVFVSSLTLVLIMALWRPMPFVVWNVDQPIFEALLWSLYAAGWVIGVTTTFLINHFELFGLEQVWNRICSQPFVPPTFKTPLFYKVVRHPMQAGFILGFWATPYMTLGHLVLTLGMTSYILIGIYFEERDLVHNFGEKYEAYRQRVPKLAPVPRPVVRQSAEV